MKLRRRATKAVSEPMLPMINVAVLLLVLLAAGARMEAPDPLPITLPQATGSATEGAEVRVFLGARGTVAYGDLRGPQALAAATVAAASSGALHLHADAEVSGADLVEILHTFAAAGVASTDLIVIGP